MVLLDHTEFLPAMTNMFKSCREIGSVVFTVKPYDGQDRPDPRSGAPGKWKKQKLVLIRVTKFTVKAGHPGGHFLSKLSFV